MAMMNELPTQTGDVIVSGKIAYTAQQPWVFSGTLRDNILFGKKFDPDKYKEALKVCALKMVRGRSEISKFIFKIFCSRQFVRQIASILYFI